MAAAKKASRLHRKRRQKSSEGAMEKKLEEAYREMAAAGRQQAVVLEDMRAQNRATIEAVLNVQAQVDRFRAEANGRFDRLESAVDRHSVEIFKINKKLEKLDDSVRKNSEDIRKNSEEIQGNSRDIRGLKEAVQSLEHKLDAKAESSTVVALQDRVAALEAAAAP
jgi:chromosome segregation ATPase